MVALGSPQTKVIGQYKVFSSAIRMKKPKNILEHFEPFITLNLHIIFDIRNFRNIDDWICAC